MEQKNRLLMIFTVISVIGFVTSFVGSYHIIAYLRIVSYTMPNDIQYIQFYSIILSIVNFVISPILTLFIFYRIGKKFDLKSNLKSSIIRLLTGAYLGRFFGITSLYLVGVFVIEGFTVYWHEYLSRIFSVSFLGLFFIAFSALAIAYFKHSDFTPTES